MPVLASPEAPPTSLMAEPEYNQATILSTGPYTSPNVQVQSPPLGPTSIYPSPSIDGSNIIRPTPRTASAVACPFSGHHIQANGSTYSDARSAHHDPSFNAEGGARSLLYFTPSLPDVMERPSQASPLRGFDLTLPAQAATANGPWALPWDSEPWRDFRGTVPSSIPIGPSPTSSIFCTTLKAGGKFQEMSHQSLLQPLDGHTRPLGTPTAIPDPRLPNVQGPDRHRSTDQPMAPAPVVTYHYAISGVFSPDDELLVRDYPPGLSPDQFLRPRYPPVNPRENPPTSVQNCYLQPSPTFSRVSSNRNGHSPPFISGSVVTTDGASEDIQSSRSVDNREQPRSNVPTASKKKRNRGAIYSLESSGASGSTVNGRAGRLKRKLGHIFGATTPWNSIIR